MMSSISSPQIIDVEHWDRREQFHFFKDFDNPFFGFTADMDVTRLYGFCHEHQFTFSLVYLYCSQLVVNGIPELRYRIRDGKVWDYPHISAGSTVLKDNQVFTFCHLEYMTDLRAFLDYANSKVASCKAPETPLGDHDDDLDQIYYSIIPWIHFHAVVHPRNIAAGDSVPAITFGKMIESAGKRMMPVSIEAHHALLDGVHLGIYYQRLQNYFDHPESLLER
jgi:chloramphenicol O-acetyltransferase type A